MNPADWKQYMQLDYYRQTNTTQFPLPFAGYKKMTPIEEKTDEMTPTLKERIRAVIADMPGPDRGKQVRLAEIAGEEKQTVNHWLTERVKVIQYDPARKICEHFGYRMDWLMKGKGPMRQGDKEQAPSKDSMALVYLTAEEQQIITDFRSTDEIGQAVIRAAAAQSKKV